MSKVTFVVKSLRQSEARQFLDSYDVFTCVVTGKALCAQAMAQICSGDSIQVVGSVAQVSKVKDKQIQSIRSVILVREFDTISTDERERLNEYEAILMQRERAKERREARTHAQELIDMLGDDGYV